METHCWGYSEWVSPANSLPLFWLVPFSVKGNGWRDSFCSCPGRDCTTRSLFARVKPDKAARSFGWKNGRRRRPKGGADQLPPPHLHSNKKYAYLLNFLLQFIKQLTVKKLPQTDFQAIAQLFEGNNTRIPAFSIQYAVNCGGRHTGDAGQGIDGQSFFPAKSKDTVGNCFFGIQFYRLLPLVVILV